VTRPGLFETMRVEAGVVLRIAAHLTRLEGSAAAHGLPFDRERALAAMRAAVATHARDAPLRLRLDLSPDGAVRARAEPFADDARATPVHVVLAEERVDAEHPRQRHKSTDRERYDRAAAWAREVGVADVVFLNGRGTVAEGAISTVFVRRDGRLRTPPIGDGALPGVLRAELLASGEAVEGSLAVDDLAGELYLGSALRGLRRAVLRATAAPRTGSAAR
jgi:para-aminobenzoate synthetase / 4-amino-4-deoxychorismate lyase